MEKCHREREEEKGKRKIQYGLVHRTQQKKVSLTRDD